MKISEMLLWILGTTLLACYFGVRYWGEHQRLEGLASFAVAQEIVPSEWSQAAHGNGSVENEWPSVLSPAYPPDAVIAVLRIPGIELEVPVYQGTTEHVLRRGAGLVEGTAFPGSAGNVGIAAHRDSHFRSLKEVAIGDRVELESSGQTRAYLVSALDIVGPEDVHVLDDHGESVLTLVTCYPFHFVGNAPQRYIVRATVADGSM